MRPIAIAACSRSGGSAKPPITLHAILAAAIAAFAASGAAAAQGKEQVYHTITLTDGRAPGLSRGQQPRLDIQAWDWGRTVTPGAGAKYGAVSGMHRDSSRIASGDNRDADVDGNGSVDALTDGLLLVRTWSPSPRPLARGAVRIKVKFPWLACRAGDRFPAAVLQGDAARTELTGVTVAACAQNEVALNYDKVIVRGWDPKKKE